MVILARMNMQNDIPERIFIRFQKRNELTIKGD